MILEIFFLSSSAFTLQVYQVWVNTDLNIKKLLIWHLDG